MKLDGAKMTTKDKFLLITAFAPHQELVKKFRSEWIKIDLAATFLGCESWGQVYNIASEALNRSTPISACIVDLLREGWGEE